MATQVETLTKVTDDVSGEENATAREFGLNGKTYVIDLADKNYDKMAKAVAALAPFLAVAKLKRAARPASDGAAIREWAQANGYDIAAGGRLSRDIRDAYAAAHPEPVEGDTAEAA